MLWYLKWVYYIFESYQGKYVTWFGNKMNAGGVNMDCKANDRDNMFSLTYCLMEIHYHTIDASDK